MPDNRKKPPIAKPQAPAITRPNAKFSALSRAVDKINAADSILVALSDDPNVDQMCAAIALTMLLDRFGKHATAIFSGEIPNAIEFLKPEETFEKNTDSLQDFIIALNKDKADHLRYMVEGDFVRIYVTPFRTTINEGDLEFSHGDYNVDLVIAFDVKDSIDLDDALTEYSRIMHDATAINISNKTAGHFAEVEWTNPNASSVCEMVMTLAKKLKIEKIEQDVATTLLTGIVAATEHFSNNLTSSGVMALAAELMSFGADQQLISANIFKEGMTRSVPEPEIVEAPAPEPVAPKIPKVKDPIPTPSDVALPEGETVLAPAPVPEPVRPTPVIPATPTLQASSLNTASLSAEGVSPVPESIATPAPESTISPAPEPATVSAPEPAPISAFTPTPSIEPVTPIGQELQPTLAPGPSATTPEPTVAPSILGTAMPPLTPEEPIVGSTPESITAPAPAPAPAPASEPSISTTPEPIISSTPEPISTPAPESTISPAPEPATVSAPEPAPISAFTPTPSIEPVTPIGQELQPTLAPGPSATTPEPTVAPSILGTAMPPLTPEEPIVGSTPESITAPAPAPASEPSISTTPEPIISSTPEPIISTTPEPIISSAPEPISTTPEPIISSAPEPISTTPEPIISSAPEPIATPTPESVSLPTLESIMPPVSEPEKSSVPVLEPAPTITPPIPEPTPSLSANPAALATPAISPAPTVPAVPEIPYEKADPDYGAMMEAELAAATPPPPQTPPAYIAVPEAEAKAAGLAPSLDSTPTTPPLNPSMPDSSTPAIPPLNPSMPTPSTPAISSLDTTPPATNPIMPPLPPEPTTTPQAPESTSSTSSVPILPMPESLSAPTPPAQSDSLSFETIPAPTYTPSASSDSSVSSSASTLPPIQPSIPSSKSSPMSLATDAISATAPMSPTEPTSPAATVTIPESPSPAITNSSAFQIPTFPN